MIPDAGRTHPLTTQPGLSAENQRLIDAFNYDELVAHQRDGGDLDDEDRAIWAELADKLQRPGPPPPPAHPRTKEEFQSDAAKALELVRLAAADRLKPPPGR